MPCTAYTDPRLAACYDAMNLPDAGDAFYIALAGEQPKTILDMGSGTGRLAVALAECGHRVTGADPSAGMMKVARSRPGTARVNWVDSDAAHLSLEQRFDLIIMTGHVFQVFLEDDAVSATLRTLRRHLAPGGALAFETRNPLVEEWREWIPSRSRETVQVPGIGKIEVHNDIAAAEGALVTYETHFRFAPDDIVVTRDTLRFMSQAELAAFLANAGFTELTWFGDWDRSPITPQSPEIIVLAGSR
ncbi:class I SAM-dependent methyltransferase [Dongia deserti]|uniref:class I SAM-dependent methyltransferase n=1 Tax=Dongia deserti TaxID=2268030 RepID=UPI000E64FAE4|nr:class I SAM-dependent methyltransferase [Dongia deserti]